jgi:hypothetical protein
MATNDQMADFEAAGISVANLSDEERQVLASLSAEEKQTLISVSKRVTDAQGDVQGFRAAKSDGGIVF